MTKVKTKTEAQYIKYLNDLIVKWQPKLLLQAHDIGLEKTKDHYMACSFRYPYMDSRVFWSDESFKDWQKGEDQERLIIHELCHVITDPLYAKSTERFVTKTEIESERERLTDNFANIIAKLEGVKPQVRPQ